LAGMGASHYRTLKIPTVFWQRISREATFSTETHRGAAMAVTSPVGGRSILRTEDLLVAIAGLPVWNDGDLAAIAKRDGSAAALAHCLSK